MYSIKKLNRELKCEGELVVCVERLVGGMGPTEVGGDSHFTVKFLLNTTAFSIQHEEPCSCSAAFWKPCGGG